MEVFRHHLDNRTHFPAAVYQPLFWASAAFVGLGTG